MNGIPGSHLKCSARLVLYVEMVPLSITRSVFVCLFFLFSQKSQQHQNEKNNSIQLKIRPSKRHTNTLRIYRCQHVYIKFK